MAMGATAAVLGASGYGGGEILRLLHGHPGLQVVVAAGATRSGQPIAAVHPHLAGHNDDGFGTSTEAVMAEVDVLFSCLPAGSSTALLDDARAACVVDLGDDHRSSPGWTYGLTEYVRSDMPVERVANPGCYPTAALLGLLPFALAGVIKGPVTITGLSGVSGAGRSPADHLGFAYMSGGVSAYGSTEHRHVREIERGLAGIGGFEAAVSFTPHLVPMSRGLLVTARAGVRQGFSDEDARQVLTSRYGAERFVHVLDHWPATKAVAGTNHALVHARVDARNSLLLCSVAIDNLGKGAAGQAIQNANLALGLDEHLGLEGLAAWP